MQDSLISKTGVQFTYFNEILSFNLITREFIFFYWLLYSLVGSIYVGEIWLYQCL